MGDGGGRFPSGRRGGGGEGRGMQTGGGRGGRGRIGGGPPANRNLVWHREDGPGQNSAANNSGKWEVAASGAAMAQDPSQAPAKHRPQAGGTRNPTPPRAADKNPVTCFNCNAWDHPTSQCPTIRCERCGKLGHIRPICQAVLPWECVAALCAFQSPGLGFFYMLDRSSPKQLKERASSIVITVLEGNPSSRDLEQEFNYYLATSWRCTARSINANQFVMRFPNPREVERACFLAKRMEMSVCKAVISMSPWSASVGAVAPLHKAWVRVRNIPTDKRCEENVAFAGSLVGVTLEVDGATVHKPEYCRILLGCRDIDKLPEEAEGVLGDNFCLFSYEIEEILIKGPPAVRIQGRISSERDVSEARSPKRHRNHNTPLDDSVEEPTDTSQNTSYGKNYSQKVPVAMEQESEEESEEEDDLLIHTIARESLQKENGEKNVELSENEILVVCVVEKDIEDGIPDVALKTDINITLQKIPMMAPVTPVVSKEIVLVEPQKMDTRSFVAAVGTGQNPEPIITELSHESHSPPVGSPEYTVQSPEEGGGNIEEGTVLVGEAEAQNARDRRQKLGMSWREMRLLRRREG